MASKQQRADEIVEFLTKRKPQAFCDDCIAENLTPPANRHYVAAITNSLGKTPAFHRADGNCNGPRRETDKRVIRAL